MLKSKRGLHVLLITITLLWTIVILSGCGETEKMESEDEDPSTAYLKELEDGVFYIRHRNFTVETPYFGYSSFDFGSTLSEVNEIETNRIMWFKDDVDKIPTLYEGDSFIYYSTKPFSESFTFERFEDMGYSIGICNMTASPTKRFRISTDSDDKCTYPGGDTDVILAHTSDYVVLEKLGEQELRTEREVEVLDENGNLTTKTESTITRCGTIVGLEKGKSYEAEIYEGTTGEKYVFVSDVFILASMDAITTMEYDFESLAVINIEIPEYFHTGFYYVCGVGMIRYVKTSEVITEEDLTRLGYDTVQDYMDYLDTTGEAPDIDLEVINYNIPNIDPEKVENENIDVENSDTDEIQENLEDIIEGTVFQSFFGDNILNTSKTSLGDDGIIYDVPGAGMIFEFPTEATPQVVEITTTDAVDMTKLTYLFLYDNAPYLPSYPFSEADNNNSTLTIRFTPPSEATIVYIGVAGLTSGSAILYTE